MQRSLYLFNKSYLFCFKSFIMQPKSLKRESSIKIIAQKTLFYTTMLQPHFFHVRSKVTEERIRDFNRNPAKVFSHSYILDRKLCSVCRGKEQGEGGGRKLPGLRGEANIDSKRGRAPGISIRKPAATEMNARRQCSTLATIKIFITSFIGFLIYSPSSNQLPFSLNV